MPWKSKNLIHDTVGARRNAALRCGQFLFRNDSTFYPIVSTLDWSSPALDRAETIPDAIGHRTSAC